MVTDELMRLRRLSTRLLLLAPAEGPGFLHLTPVPVESVAVDALDRWGHTPRHWRLGLVAEMTVLGDRDRLAVALDALLENAVAHRARRFAASGRGPATASPPCAVSPA